MTVRAVMTGLVPVIPINAAKRCPLDRDCRVKPGNDGVVHLKFENSTAG
jgi:hypothetical protein